MIICAGRPRARGWQTGFHQVTLALTAAAMLLPPALVAGEPVLYEGGGDWFVIAGLPPTATPPAAGWRHENGLWIGRWPEGLTNLEWKNHRFSRDSAQPPPLPPAHLPITKKPFGPCVLETLSLRYESVVRSRPWTIVFLPPGEEPVVAPLTVFDGRQLPLALQVEDALTRRRWILRPLRHGRELEAPRGIFYGGVIDDGAIDWSLMIIPAASNQYVFQGRLMAATDADRYLRFRLLFLCGTAGISLLQEEPPAGVLALADGMATALYPDPAEPRRCRRITDAPGFSGLEFDLALTRATGNFPRSATFSLSVEVWPQTDPAEAEREALLRLTPAAPTVALPPEILTQGLAVAPRYEPARQRLVHPGGFHNSADALHYLTLRTTGLFSDYEWATSAFLCAARESDGSLRMTRHGDEAILYVNPDPDLETILAMGQNRGWQLLTEIHRRRPPAVWLRLLGPEAILDYNGRALHLCDYPAIWQEGVFAPAVDLRHAEIELLGALACVLRREGIRLLVEDSGPYARNTTYYADALVCTGTDPDEMRRQHALAAGRPVLWLAESPAPEAVALAQEFGFVSVPALRQE